MYMDKKSEVSLSVRHIIKTYPGVVALKDISVDFYAGEVHGLMGENGAGKSTLMKAISGVIEPDEGIFYIGSDEFRKITPHQAQEKGLRIIHQELNLIPTLSVTENIFMGRFMGNGWTVKFSEMKKRTWELFQEIGIKIDPDALVENLTVAQMQLVEIAKAVSQDVKILIMDEPTAPLTQVEVELLFRLIRKLKEKGVTIIYISHRISEIFELTDRITIMRDGEKVMTEYTKNLDRETLINLMVGRTLKETYPERTKKPQEEILRVEHLYGNGLEDINFTLRKGEILGLAGLVGAGRTELVRLIFGADPVVKGKIYMEGKEIRISNPKEAVKHGIVLIPEDRKRQGVVLELSIKENLTLPNYKKISRRTLINKNEEKKLVKRQVEQLRIKTPSEDQLVKNLSGGNQQKVVVGKWLAGKSKILIFDEPTRGIDVGAKQEIYFLMNQLTEQGISILMVSSEMEELMGMSDRILVLREGKISGSFDKSEEPFTQESIMKYASIE